MKQATRRTLSTLMTALTQIFPRVTRVGFGFRFHSRNVGIRRNKTLDISMEDNSGNTQCWQGWTDKERRFGLEMQHPYSELLVDGAKSIESRSYPLPEALLDTKIEILQSEKGQDGISSVPNRVTLHKSTDNDNYSSSQSPLKRIGWVTFSACIQYTREEFESDREKHLVDPNSGYCWNDERPMFGWVVGSYHKQEKADGENVDTVAIRRMRSLFEVITT
jgi:hypothetical protein